MFGSKKPPAAPKMPWAIQILTTEYLIDGSVQPEEFQTNITPNDDASRRAAQQAFKDFKYPLGAVVYVGPYRIRGTLLSDRADRPSPSRASLLPLQGAEIDSQLQGGKPTGLQAAWLLLNGGLSHGLGMP